MEIKIGNYEVISKLGRGAFGEVYKAKHIDNNKEFAIKMETKESKQPQLFHEAKILKSLNGSKGIPEVKHYTTTDEYYVMVFELLGPSLEELFKY
jgi:serine/threonine protein kinase